MERDFLGMNGKDSGSGSRQDPVFGGGQAVQWPFSNKISALQQFMTYRAGQEERAKKLVFDQLSSSGFQSTTATDAFEASHKASPMQPQQKCFTLDRQGAFQFSMFPYQSQSTNLPCVPVHNSVPVATRSPFFKVQGSPNGPNLTISASKPQPEGGEGGGGIGPYGPLAGSTIGAFTPRNVSKPSPATSQLTIFYAGSVNVYDDVPLDKAQAIMFMASKGSNASLTALNPRLEQLAPSVAKVTGVELLSMNQTQIQALTQNHVASPCSGISSALSVSSHTVAQSGCVSSTTDDLVGAKSSRPPTPNNKNEPSNTPNAALGSAAPVSVMPRAIPQARKISLARFLEKRKERVANAAPYASSKKPFEDTNGIEGPPSKSGSNDIGLPRNGEELWNLGSEHKNCVDSGENPSTKLEM